MGKLLDRNKTSLAEPVNYSEEETDEDLSVNAKNV